MLKYFSESEFQRCRPACSVFDCDEVALVMLDTLRERCGFPLVLNSAYRSFDYEKKKGRKGTSSHCKGLAFDIRCNDSFYRAELVRCALEVGFTRIGIAKTFVHVDCDYSKPYPSIWLY